jgi:tetratricopeptide (TPR) repeat protein
MLAYHYSRSKNQVKAYQFLKLSGHKAKRNNSHGEAFRLFKEALEVLHQMPPATGNERDRLEILRVMVYSMRALGYPEGSIEFLREGEALAKELGDEKALAQFFSYIGSYYVIAGGDPVLGKTYIEKGLSASELTREVDIIAPLVLELANFYSISGSYWKICEVVPQCIKLIERTRTQSETFRRSQGRYAVLQAQHGAAMGAIGNFDTGEHIFRDCRECARQISDRHLVTVELYQGVFYLFKGDGKNSVEHYEAAARLCEKIQFVYMLGLAWGWAGLGYLLLEQAEKALDHLEKGLRIHLDVGIPLWLGSIHAGLGLAHLQLGNLEQAQVHAEEGVNLSRANNQRDFEALAEIYLGRAICAGGSGRFYEAKEHILRGIETFEELKMKPYTAVAHFHLGELSTSSGRTEEAMEHLQEAEARFRQMGMDDWLGKAQEALAKL